MFSITLLFADEKLDAKNENPRKDLYMKLLPDIKSIHKRGPHTYSTKELEELGYKLKGLSSPIVIVRQNNVDIVTLSEDSKIVRHTFTRFVGAWTPKKVVWNANSYSDDLINEQIFLGGETISDLEYQKNKLYNTYIDSITSNPLKSQ